MAHDVFISYSTHDKALADAVCAGLERQRLRCWIAPRDVVGGANWAESIIDAIEGSRAFVLLLSVAANESHQVMREVERAASKGIPIIPMRLEDVAPSKSLEFYLSATHWLDAISPPAEAHIERLARAVRAAMGIAKPSPTLEIAASSTPPRQGSPAPPSPPAPSNTGHVMPADQAPRKNKLARTAITLSNWSLIGVAAVVVGSALSIPAFIYGVRGLHARWRDPGLRGADDPTAAIFIGFLMTIYHLIWTIALIQVTLGT